MSKHIECCMMLNYTTSWISRNAWHNSKRCGCLNFAWRSWRLCANIYQPTFVAWSASMNLYNVRVNASIYMWMMLSVSTSHVLSQPIVHTKKIQYIVSVNITTPKYIPIIQYMGVSKKMGKPPNHPFVHRVFHYFHHPFWGVYHPYFWKHPYILTTLHPLASE